MMSILDDPMYRYSRYQQPPTVRGTQSRGQRGMEADCCGGGEHNTAIERGEERFLDLNNGSICLSSLGASHPKIQQRCRLDQQPEPKPSLTLHPHCSVAAAAAAAAMGGRLQRLMLIIVETRFSKPHLYLSAAEVAANRCAATLIDGTPTNAHLLFSLSLSLSLSL
jgi:hypothetical protein